MFEGDARLNAGRPVFFAPNSGERCVDEEPQEDFEVQNEWRPPHGEVHKVLHIVQQVLPVLVAEGQGQLQKKLEERRCVAARDKPVPVVGAVLRSGEWFGLLRKNGADGRTGAPRGSQTRRSFCC